MSGAITVRNGKLSDGPFIRKCISSLMNICLGTNQEYKWPKFDKMFDHVIKNPVETPVFVAEKNGEPVGCALCNRLYLLEMGSKTLNIADLVVDDKYRGQGVGAVLMDHLKKYCKENDYGALEALTPRVGTEKYKERMAFYEKHGFFQVGPGVICDLEPENIQ